MTAGALISRTGPSAATAPVDPGCRQHEWIHRPEMLRSTQRPASMLPRQRRQNAGPGVYVIRLDPDWLDLPKVKWWEKSWNVTQTSRSTPRLYAT